MSYIKQSTAYTFRLGPFVDSTDGFTEENALTIAAASVLLSKNGGAFAAKNDTTALTSTGASGHYTCPLNTTDTNTLGMLRVYANISGALPVFKDFMVLPANVYDSLVAGSDTLQADVTQWLGTAAATPTVAGVPEVDVTHFNGSAGTFASGRPEVNTTHLGGSAVVQSGGRPEVNATHIDGVSATNLRHSLSTMQVVTVSTGSTSTSITTQNLSGVEATNDHYKGKPLYFLTGNLAKQIVEITAYNGTTGTLTVTATPSGESPANNDTALIL